MKIIFEDNEKQSISELFKALLGEDVEFSGGADNIKGMLEDLSAEERIYVYCDVVPDNAMTVATYTTLVEKKEDFPNLIVIPIPGAEYIAMESMFYLFDSLGDTDACVQLNNIFQQKELTFVPDGEGSFEVQCKGLLTKGCACVQNVTYKEGSPKGLYYHIDCPCEFKYCRYHRPSISREKKAFTMLERTLLAPEHPAVLKYARENGYRLDRIPRGEHITSIEERYRYLGRILGMDFNLEVIK